MTTEEKIITTPEQRTDADIVNDNARKIMSAAKEIEKSNDQKREELKKLESIGDMLERKQK